jgi:hypothetical protein
VGGAALTVAGIDDDADNNNNKIKSEASHIGRAFLNMSHRTSECVSERAANEPLSARHVARQCPFLDAAATACPRRLNDHERGSLTNKRVTENPGKFLKYSAVGMTAFTN